MHVAVRLRPQANLPGDRFRQRVLQIELAVEIALDLVARDADFEVVPLAGWGRGGFYPFDGRLPALFGFSTAQVGFKGGPPHLQVVAHAVWIVKDGADLIHVAP